MPLLNFFNHKTSHQKVVYILDFLLHVAVSESFQKKKNLDINLYNLLNSRDVNQEIHKGLIPIIKYNNNLDDFEFIDFVDNLYDYIIYDEKYEDLYFKIHDEGEAKKLYLKTLSARKLVLDYLYNKKVIDNSTFSTESDREVKFWIKA